MTESQSSIDELVDHVHEFYNQKHGIDVHSIVKDSNLNMLEKRDKFLRSVQDSLINKHNHDKQTVEKHMDPFLTAMPTQDPKVWTPTLWYTPDAAAGLMADSGSEIQTAVLLAKDALNLEELAGNYASEIVVVDTIGVVGIGVAVLFEATMIQTTILTAGTTAAAALAAGANAAAVAAAAETAALAAAAQAGITGTAAVAAGEAAAAAGVAGTASWAGGIYACAAAFIASPVGILVLAVLVAALVASLIFWLANRERSVGGLIVNNTDYELSLTGGNVTTTGVYQYTGTMDYFPGMFVENEEKNGLVYQSAGIPARGVDKNSGDALIPVGFFGCRNESGSADGFFSMALAGEYLVFTYANPTVAATGVYIWGDPMTDTAENIFNKYYKLSSQEPDPYRFGDPAITCTAKADSKHGTEAFAIYALEQ